MRYYRLYSSVTKKWTDWLTAEGDPAKHSERKDAWEFLMVHTDNQVYVGWVRGGSLALDDKRELAVFGLPCLRSSDDAKPEWFNAKGVSIVNTVELDSQGLPKPDERGDMYLLDTPSR